MKRVAGWPVAGGRLFTPLLFVCLFLAAMPAFAGNVDEVLAGVQKNYAAMRDMRAIFTQESFNRVSKMTIKESGEVFIRRPGLMRWEYKMPQPKQLVINNRTTWFYIPEDRQVVKGEVEETAFAFLTHNRAISDDFDAVMAGGDAKSAVVELTPRKKMGSISKVRLSVKPGTWEVQKVVTVDGFGNTTTITLSDVQMNVNLLPGLFEFTVPKGVKVMETQAEGR